jgi:hypothetical protein
MVKTTLLVTALAFLSTAAYADIVTVTVTGTIAPYTWNGSSYTSNPLIDTAGRFGTVGANLFGDAYTATWTVNTGSATEYISGGSAPNTTSPILSTILTINGFTLDFGLGGYGAAYQYHYPGTDYFMVNTTIGNNAMNSYVSSSNQFPGNLTTPWTYNVNPLTDNLDHVVSQGQEGIGGGFIYGDLRGYFLPETFTLTDQSQQQSFVSQSAVSVPGPIVGAGLPELAILLLAWLSRSTVLHRPRS